MEAKISTFIGMAMGCIARIMTGDLGTALLTAFFTGIVAYIGQQVAKMIHKKFNK